MFIFTGITNIRKLYVSTANVAAAIYLRSSSLFDSQHNYRKFPVQFQIIFQLNQRAPLLLLLAAVSSRRISPMDTIKN
jgi:hypothetical protein